MLKPLNDNILIEMIEISKEETITGGGIILSANTELNPVNMRTATVRAVSDECTSIAEGDVVYIPGMNLVAAQVIVDGKEMYLVIEKTIVAKEQ